WFHPSGGGRLDEDGRLQVIGRVDDVVVSGGVKVPVTAVARRLREHLLLTDAEVLGVPDVEWGQRVVAVVVGNAGEAELRDWVSLEHPRSWAPRAFRGVDRLTLHPTGQADPE